MKLSARYWIPTSLLALLAATEITLRLALGLGNPVLSQADPDTGYRFQPNQKLFRFGKHIEYNQYSQRSEPIAPEKPQGTLRLLMTGDSVLNGGNPTDQKQTISELLEAKISASNPSIEVLNASAGSWGIGNQLGYLRKFGTFESNAVILQIGTHDLTQPTSTNAPVGHHPAFPTHPPLLATQEAFTRYILPRLSAQLELNSRPTDASPTTTPNPARQFEQNMQNLEAIVTLVRRHNIPVFVLFTPDRKDLIPTSTEPKHKAEFFQHLKALQVPTIDTQATWSTLPKTTVDTYFRDSVHLSEAGNQAAANLLFEYLCVKDNLPACSVSQ